MFTVFTEVVKHVAVMKENINVPRKIDTAIFSVQTIIDATYIK